MVKKLHIVFLFYRSYLLPSALLNILLIIFGISATVAIAVKLALILFVITGIVTGPQRNQLTFYRNFSISSILLFGSSIVFDLLLLLLTYLFFSYGF